MNLSSNIKTCKVRMKSLGIIVIVPTYNNGSSLKTVLEDIQIYADDILVVNDGSTDDTATILCEMKGIKVITHNKNMGKGRALRNGFLAARKQGFRYAITIDSDGQHYPSDIPVFVDEIEKKPDRLLIGARDFDTCGIPSKNSFANKFSNFWYYIETGRKMRDTQSGYRLYPLDKIGEMKYATPRYEFELALIVLASWKGIEVDNVSISVYYPPPEERVSHFRPFWDFTRISLLNTILVIIAFLWAHPKRFFNKLSWNNVKALISREVIHSGESGTRIVSAIMLGVFMGIVPIWGYQMISAVFLAVLLRLNKVIVLLASNISIPPVIPFLLYGSYRMGCFITQTEMKLSLHDISLANIQTVLYQYLVGSFVFAALCAVLAGTLSGLILFVFRRRNVSYRDEETKKTPDIR